MAKTKSAKMPSAEARAAVLHRRWGFVAQVYLYALIVIFPLVIGNYGHAGGAVIAKLDYYLFLTVAVLVAFFACYCVSLMDGQIPDMHLIKRFKAGALYEKALILYIAFTVLSFLIGSEDKSVGLWGVRSQSSGLIIQCCYFVNFFVLSRYYRPKQRDIIIAVVIAALTAAYGLLTYFGIDPLSLLPPTYVGSNGRRVIFYSTMSNYNFYSPYLCIMFCLGAGWMVHNKGYKSLLLLPALLILFAMVAFGNMRGGLAGILGAFVLGTPLIVRGRKSLGKLLTLLGGLLGILYLEDIARVYTDSLAYGAAQEAIGLRPLLLAGALVLLAIGIFLLLSRDAWFEKLPKVQAKFLRRGWYILLAVLLVVGWAILPSLAEGADNLTLEQAAALSRGDFDDNYMSGRMYIWNRAVRLFPNKPILGYGPDGFDEAFNELYAYNIVDDWPDVVGPARFDKAHNDYLQLLIDGGLLGLLSYLAFFLALFWSARKKTADAFLSAAFFAVIAYLLQANFNYTITINGPPFWTVVGLFAAALRLLPEEKSILEKQAEMRKAA